MAKTFDQRQQASSSTSGSVETIIRNTGNLESDSIVPLNISKVSYTYLNAKYYVTGDPVTKFSGNKYSVSFLEPSDLHYTHPDKGLVKNIVPPFELKNIPSSFYVYFILNPSQFGQVSIIAGKESRVLGTFEGHLILKVGRGSSSGFSFDTNNVIIVSESLRLQQSSFGTISTFYDPTESSNDDGELIYASSPSEERIPIGTEGFDRYGNIIKYNGKLWQRFDGAPSYEGMYGKALSILKLVLKQLSVKLINYYSNHHEFPGRLPGQDSHISVSTYHRNMYNYLYSASMPVSESWRLYYFDEVDLYKLPDTHSQTNEPWVNTIGDYYSTFEQAVRAVSQGDTTIVKYILDNFSLRYIVNLHGFKTAQLFLMPRNSSSATTTIVKYLNQQILSRWGERYSLANAAYFGLYNMLSGADLDSTLMRIILNMIWHNSDPSSTIYTDANSPWAFAPNSVDMHVLGPYKESHISGFSNDVTISGRIYDLSAKNSQFMFNHLEMFRDPQTASGVEDFTLPDGTTEIFKPENDRKLYDVEVIPSDDIKQLQCLFNEILTHFSEQSLVIYNTLSYLNGKMNNSIDKYQREAIYKMYVEKGFSPTFGSDPSDDVAYYVPVMFFDALSSAASGSYELNISFTDTESDPPLVSPHIIDLENIQQHLFSPLIDGNHFALSIIDLNSGYANEIIPLRSQ